MMNEPPQDAVEALAAGRKLEAIDRYRRATGATLKQANDWAQSFQGLPQSGPRHPIPPFIIPKEAREAFHRGNLVGAARITRDAFKQYLAALPTQAARPMAGAKEERPVSMRATSPPSVAIARARGLSPGEVPRGPNEEGVVAIVLMIVALVVIIFLV